MRPIQGGGQPEETMAKRKKKQRSSGKFKQALWQVLRQGIRAALQVSMFRVFDPHSYRRHPQMALADSGKGVQKQGLRVLLGQLVDAVIPRLIVLPVLFLLFVGVIFYSTLCPARVPLQTFPEALRLYYEKVQFFSEDGTELHAWFIPSLSADDVVEDGDQALKRQKPGVVLCHGLGASRDQLLALAGYLNANDFEVLLFDFRACGLSGGETRSLGLRERNDVLAAVHYLADRSSVDKSRIAVVGQDIGGAAALGAAARDHSIDAVVVGDIDADLHTAIDRRLAGLGVLREVSVSAYLAAYKGYFHTSDRQVSSAQMAESLDQQQGLLVLTRKGVADLAESAKLVAKYSHARTVSAELPSSKHPSLTDPQAGAIIVDFLENCWNVPAEPVCGKDESASTEQRMSEDH